MGLGSTPVARVDSVEREVSVVDAEYQEPESVVLSVGKAQYIVDQVPLVGVMLPFEVPVNAFGISGDQVSDDPGKGVSIGHFRSRLRSWGRVRFGAEILR